MKMHHKPRTQKPWNSKEFLTYLLFYAAHADNKFSEAEKSYILSKIEYPTYNKIWEEYAQDNDYQHIQKVLIFQRQYQPLSKDLIIKELNHLFLADHHFHTTERYMLSTFSQLLS